MGTLRIMLALGVLLGHCPGLRFSFLNGGLAVELFFIISGFYMALILSGKYSRKIGTFYTNRLLRLVPVYYIFLVLQVFCLLAVDAHLYLSRQEFFSFLAAADFSTLVAVAFSNTLILGQEVFSFLALDQSSSLIFSPEHSDSEAWKLLLIPQTWSISIELMFYALAPFLVRRSKLLITLLGGSFVLHQAILYSDLSYDSWGRRFFPAELWYFLLGMAAYKFSAGKKELFRRIELRPVIGASLLLGLLLFFARFPPNSFMRQYVYVVIAAYLAVLLPFLFYRISFKLDGLLGNLSYSLYILHTTVIGVGLKTLRLSGGGLQIFAVTASLILAAVVYYLVEGPIDRYRQRRMSISATHGHNSRVQQTSGQ